MVSQAESSPGLRRRFTGRASRSLLGLALLAACRSEEPEPDPGAPVRIESSGVVRCEAPERRAIQRFDVIGLAGEEPSPEPGFEGGGLAVGDVDGDGRMDLVIPGHSETRLLRGTPEGTWVEDGSFFWGSTFDRATGATLADYDGDGDLDLLITRALRPDVLLRNDGDRWVDVSAQAGLSAEATRSMAASWADVDGDGDLDLFIGSHGARGEGGPPGPADRSILYENQGDGTFIERPLPAAASEGFTLAGGLLDLNGDGRPELYLVNDLGSHRPNTVLWNQGGVLVEGDPGGLGLAVNGAGLARGDLNGDGLPDLVVPHADGIALLMSERGPRWEEVGAQVGVVPEPAAGQRFGWGAQLADLDHDGEAELVVAYGWLHGARNAPRRQPDALFVRGSDGHYTDQAEAWGLADQTIGRGVVVADLNGDGWPDLVKRDLAGPTRVYLSRCGEEAWLRLGLRDRGPNSHAIGARIRLWSQGTVQTRWIEAGATGFGTSGPPEAHFGLGSDEEVDRIEITWPDGAVSWLRGIPSRQHLELSRR